MIGHADEAENLQSEFVDDRLQPIKELRVLSIVVDYLLPPIATAWWMASGNRTRNGRPISPVYRKNDPVATSIVKHEKRV